MLSMRLGVTELLPPWSGQFYEFDGEGLAMMLVSNFDETQHRPPQGWAPIHHSTSLGGDFEVYTYRRVEAWEQ